MDRRIRKTREAIFSAFVELLSKKDIDKITVGEIIKKADVGRATFYSHFETKDYLIKELSEELFCHIFDTMNCENKNHKHIFDCDAAESGFLHLILHLQKNDNKILDLFSCQNNEMFLTYFKNNLQKLVASQSFLFELRKNEKLPDELWTKHIANVFVEIIRWWTDNKMRETPEEILEYFYLLV